MSIRDKNEMDSPLQERLLHAGIITLKLGCMGKASTDPTFCIALDLAGSEFYDDSKSPVPKCPTIVKSTQLLQFAVPLAIIHYAIIYV